MSLYGIQYRESIVKAAGLIKRTHAEKIQREFFLRLESERVNYVHLVH